MDVMKLEAAPIVQLRSCALGLATFALWPATRAASLYWDGSSTSANADGGSGVWSTAVDPANWDTSSAGGTASSWADGSDAVFGGTGGTVTIAGAVSAASLAFTKSGYSLTGGSVALTGTPAIDVGGNDVVLDSTVAGTVAISKNGAGMLTLGGANTFTRGFTVTAGTVKVASATALGSTQFGTVISPGATLDLNGQNLGTEPLTISGSGMGAAGAIVNTGANALNALQNLTLAGPASVGGTARFDIRANFSSSFQMGGHALTKTGPNDFHLVKTNVTSPGSIDVQEGSLWVELDSNLGGTATNLVTIRSGATLAQWGNTREQLWKVAFEDNSTWLALYQSSRWRGPVTLAGATMFEVGGGGWGDDATMLSLGVISGPGSMTKSGPGTWTLSALNTFVGGTTVTTGALVLNAAGGGVGTLREAVSVEAGGTLVLPVANALGTAPGSRVNPLVIDGGLVDNTSTGGNALAVLNFTSGRLRSNGGVNSPDATSCFTMADDAVIHSMAAPTVATMTGRLHLGMGNSGSSSGFDVEAGTGIEDLRIDAAVTEAAAGSGITKVGTGLLAVNGACLFTGTTTVQAGTLLLTSHGSLEDSPVIVHPAARFGSSAAGKSLAALTAHNGSTLILPAQAGATTSVTGTLALAGGSIGISPILGADTPAGTYDLLTTGGITGTGTPVLNLAGAFGPTRATGTLAVNGSTLQLTVTGTGADLVWNNASAGAAATGIWDTTLANFSRGGTDDRFQAFDSVTFNDSIVPGSAKTISLGATLAPARLTVDNSNGDYTFSSTGGLAGAGSLVKTGSSNLTVGGPHSYAMTGDITAGGGILDFAGKSVFASKLTIAGGGAFNQAMATLRSMDLQSGSANATLSGDGAWMKSTAGTVHLTANNRLSGPGTVAAGHLVVGHTSPPGNTGSLGTGSVAIAAGATVTIARGDSSPLVANAFSGAGGLTLQGSNNGSNGTSSFQLTGDSSAFSGPITIADALVTPVTGKEIGSGPILLTGRGGIYASRVNLPNAISISPSGSWETGGSSFGGNLILEQARLTGPLTLAGATNTSVRLMPTSNQATRTAITGPIGESGGSASLTFSSLSYNTIDLEGASTYSGTTWLSGPVVVNLNGSLGPTAVTVFGLATIGGNGSIGNGGSLTFNNRAILKARMSGGGLTVNGPVNLGPKTNVTVEVTQDPVLNGPIPVLQYTGALTGTSANLSMDSPANYRQAVFAFTPGLITLDIGTKAIIWKGASSSIWQSGSGSKCWNTNGTGETDSFFNGDHVTFDDTGSGYVISPYTLSPSSVLVNNPTKDYVISATISGPCALTKNGNGGLRLGSTGTYTGGTTVNAGRLEVTISPLGSGPVTVAAGATLAGDATIAGPVTIAGTLDPGLTGQSWPSTLATGPATLSGTYACQLDSSTSDRLSVTGDLDLSGSSLVLTQTFYSYSPALYTIASYTGTLTGSFSSVTGMPPGYALKFDAAGKQILILRMTLADWAAGFAGLGDSTADGDPDRDGAANLLEYVLGGNPTTSDPAILPKPSLTTGNLVFRYKRSDFSRSNTTQVVQWSTDMIGWIDIPVTPTSSGQVHVIENGDAPDDIAATIPRVGETMFARLKVTQP
jgi:fibronectin-binding autotransporter adhesin